MKTSCKRFGPSTPAGRSRKRKGTLLVLAAFCMIAIAAFAAFTIDVGYISLTRAKLQNAADAGALAAAMELDATAVQNTVEANVVTAACDAASRNRGGKAKLLMAQATEPISIIRDSDILLGRREYDPATGDYTLFFGSQYTPYNIVKVVASRSMRPATGNSAAADLRLPLFFAPLIGHQYADITVSSIATFQARDVMLVLDLSASMNNDSELKSISSLGQAAVEANLLEIWQDLGSPVYGNLVFTPTYIDPVNPTSSVKTALGLDTIAYPYASGSWDAYIDYVKTSSTVNNAGYRDMYGGLTLINYWLEYQPKYNQTADLWKTREQPITAMKDAVTLFLNYLKDVEAEDKVGLSVFNSVSQDALLEIPLTNDLDLIDTTSRARQAGHYDSSTNIGAGLRQARLELEQNARPKAFRMIVLITDGQATSSSTGASPDQSALDEAYLAAASKIKVLTISLGAGADMSLMQQIADITDGTHFNVPGGQTVAQYTQELQTVFGVIAADRPLKLIYEK